MVFFVLYFTSTTCSFYFYLIFFLERIDDRLGSLERFVSKKKGSSSFFFLFLFVSFFFGSLVGFDGTINTARTHEDT